MTAVLIWFLVVAASALVGAEVIGWCGPAQRALLRRAAAKLPPEHRGRYIEEWMAELDALPGGPLRRFWFTAPLLVHSRQLESELRNRTRTLADMLLELEIRSMKAVFLPHMIVAEAPDGERYAWRWERHLLTRVSVPDENLGLEHLPPLDFKYLSPRAATAAAESQREPTSSTAEEVSLPAPIYEAGS